MESTVDLDFFASAEYEIQLLAQTHSRNLLVYLPLVKLENFVCLKTIQDGVHLTSSPYLEHVLVIAPTEYVVKHTSQFLKRHLHISSIKSWLGSSSDESSQHMFGDIAENLWPKVIVSTLSALSSLFSSGLKISQLALIIIYDCSNSIHSGYLNEVIKNVKNEDKRPKILCFTTSVGNNCLNAEEMISALKDLEELSSCKLATVSDHHILTRVLPITTDIFCTYKPYEIASKSCEDVFRELDELVEKCHRFDFKFSDDVHKYWSKNKNCSCVPDILINIKNQTKELGEYAGSVSTLVAIRNLIHLNAFTDDTANQTTKHMLNYLICCVAKFRKILEEDMFRIQKCERVERFSSEKVKYLLNVLKELKKDQRAIIVVNESQCACILTTVLQNVAKHSNSYSCLKSEVIIDGCGIPKSDSWHDILSWTRNIDVYARFVSVKTNVVVVSGDLQCLDLPESDVVIAMEMIEHFSQFISLKKFIKNHGKLLMLCDESNAREYQEQIKSFQAMESKMREMLVKVSKFQESKQYPDESVVSEDLFLCSSGTGKVVNLKNSISVVNRFCSQLPPKLFSYHQPMWQRQEIENTPSDKNVMVTLHLPRILSHHTFKGEGTTFETAKKVAAFRAVRDLYFRKELNDNFELQVEASVKKNTVSEDGIDEMQFLCSIVYPQALTEAQPLPGLKSFIHEIRMKPVSEAPLPGDNRKTVLYDLLCDRSCFAIVSAKPLPKVCTFPVFAYGHEIQVELVTVQREVVFSKEEYLNLRKFHSGIFLSVISLVHCFAQFDNHNKENSFFIAPLTSEGNIDWETVRNHPSVPDVRDLSPEERSEIQCTPETHERKMVTPWYRLLPNYQIYLVASVCEDMCADSCFPTDDFESFTEYFRERYSIELVRPDLPMLEVCLINLKFNALLPRSPYRKLRREEKMEDFREHMVPELCNLLLFPSSLWLKLAIVPSVLHRLSRFLVMDSLRRQIVHETGVGELEKDWPAFCVDHFSCIEEAAPCKIPPSAVKRGLVIGNVKLEERKCQAQLKKPWGATQEPLDIDRHLETLSEFEIHYFEEFIMRDCSGDNQTCPERSTDVKERGFEDVQHSQNVQTPSDENDTYINLLNTNRFGCGPMLHEILEAFTSASSSDVVNMDRIHLLGNTFFNFVVSVYLFLSKTSASSTKLWQLQRDLLDREKLAQCGNQKNLCGIIKTIEFSPGDWIPPCFSTPQMLKSVLISEDLNPSVLLKIYLSQSEQLSGIINEESQDKILEILSDYENGGISKREEAFLGRQYVTVETASSSVEALIGTYFKSCGWDGALKIIEWLGLFPSGIVSGLLDREVARVSFSIPISLSYQLASLELLLNYKFEDKHLLLEAVTHSSYVNPSVSGCMDRLVFLGKAILDILVTTYIFEKCDSLTPSKLSSLREAMLSHSTLAALGVRHELHKYLLMGSSSLLSAVDRFVVHQEKNLHEINDEVVLLIEEHECDSIDRVELPAVLGDLLPSLVGALYLDAGKNLMSTWNKIHPVFVPQINTWKDNVPFSVVELLMDLSPAAHQVIFSMPVDSPNGGVEISCTLLVDNAREEVFHAVGSGEIQAKTLAAKLALRALLGRPEATIEF